MTDADDQGAGGGRTERDSVESAAAFGATDNGRIARMS